MMRELVGAIDEVESMLNESAQVSYKQNQPMDKAKNISRCFRNPPQPHMCVQDYILGSREPCYINVLSWIKISTPKRPDDPIPLYGGMRVPQNTTPSIDKKRLPPRRSPVIFAVMANPEILRLNGKTASDPSDRAALVDLMLDFVEAMNPSIRFSRNFHVLEDRDLAGELKDIWTAIQIKREREKANARHVIEYRKAVEQAYASNYCNREERVVGDYRSHVIRNRTLEDSNNMNVLPSCAISARPMISIQTEFLPSSSDSSEEDDRSESTCVEDSELPNDNDVESGLPDKGNTNTFDEQENNLSHTSNEKHCTKVCQQEDCERSQQICHKSQKVQDENVADNAQDLNSVTVSRITNPSVAIAHKRGPCRPCNTAARPSRSTPQNHQRGISPHEGSYDNKSDLKCEAEAVCT